MKVYRGGNVHARTNEMYDFGTYVSTVSVLGAHEKKFVHSYTYKSVRNIFSYVKPIPYVQYTYKFFARCHLWVKQVKKCRF